MTTKEKIIIMQASDAGEIIEARQAISTSEDDWVIIGGPVFNWHDTEYRVFIKPEETLLEKIQKEFPGNEVRLLKLVDEVLCLPCLSSHVMAQSMIGFENYVYERGFTLSPSPLKALRGNILTSPIAALFVKKKSKLPESFGES